MMTNLTTSYQCTIKMRGFILTLCVVLVVIACCVGVEIIIQFNFFLKEIFEFRMEQQLKRKRLPKRKQQQKPNQKSL